MKFVLFTIPIRSIPTNYPPIAVTALLDTLISAGYDPLLYDLDTLRPDIGTIESYLEREKPDIIGISAVVSTAYGYTKNLCQLIHRVSPNTKIIVGGNLAASAEILLRKCSVDICVIGEGEKVLLNLVRFWERHKSFDSNISELSTISGIAFIDKNGDFIFTGYEVPLLPEEMRLTNYDLLAKYSDINRFVFDPLSRGDFANDPRSYEAKRRGQKAATIVTGKGCAARCTFCHRWYKGYRPYNVKNILGFIKHLKVTYNVGFFCITDESFGTDRKMLDDLLNEIKSLDILFQVGGIRASTICSYPEVVNKMKEAGCVAMYLGIESGSDKILKIMEKRTSSRENMKALDILAKNKMHTVIQLVVGMPGENESTIKETVEFIKQATDKFDYVAYDHLSVNYFQALPGTPAYEFARSKGLIGSTLDEEETYLLCVSDIDAWCWKHYVNVSEECVALVSTWQTRIINEATINCLKKRGWKISRPAIGNNSGLPIGICQPYFKMSGSYYEKGVFFWQVLWLLHWLIRRRSFFRARARYYGFWKAIWSTLGLVEDESRKDYIISEPQSLRKLVSFPDSSRISISEANMLPLRQGR